jgi:protein TonB
MGSALAIAAGVHALVGVALVRTAPTPKLLVEVTPELTLRPEPATAAAPEPAGGSAAPAKPRRKSAPPVPVVAHAGEEDQNKNGEPSGPPNQTALASTQGSGSGSGTGNGSGTGASAGAGAGAGIGSAPIPTVDRSAILKDVLDRIRAARHYPELARRRGIEGVVTIGFRVLADGKVADLRVRRGAAPALDEAALDAVRRAAPLPAALAASGPLEVDLDFRLSE